MSDLLTTGNRRAAMSTIERLAELAKGATHGPWRLGNTWGGVMINFLWRCGFQVLVVPFVWLGGVIFQHQSSAAFEVAVVCWIASGYVTYLIWTVEDKAQ